MSGKVPRILCPSLVGLVEDAIRGRKTHGLLEEVYPNHWSIMKFLSNKNSISSLGHYDGELVQEIELASSFRSVSDYSPPFLSVCHRCEVLSQFQYCVNA